MTNIAKKFAKSTVAGEAQCSPNPVVFLDIYNLANVSFVSDDLIRVACAIFSTSGVVLAKYLDIY